MPAPESKVEHRKTRRDSARQGSVRQSRISLKLRFSLWNFFYITSPDNSNPPHLGAQFLCFVFDKNRFYKNVWNWDLYIFLKLWKIFSSFKNSVFLKNFPIFFQKVVTIGSPPTTTLCDCIITQSLFNVTHFLQPSEKSAEEFLTHTFGFFFTFS